MILKSSSQLPLLSVIITTRNEEANISSCIEPLLPFRDKGEIDIIVVDNASTDKTCESATNFGVKVFQQGPERSAQRNRGVKESNAAFVMYLDADMIANADVMREILERIKNDDIDALYVREVRVGNSLRTKARNFERSFYDATVIDAVRVIRRSLYLELGGFDEALTGAEDWDFDRRIAEKTTRVFLTDGFLSHNEKEISLLTILKKKSYYSNCFALYQAKWLNDEIVRKQFGFYYRFIGVYVENGKWKKILAHPILFFVMMLERFLVGVVYLAHKKQRKQKTD